MYRTAAGAAVFIAAFLLEGSFADLSLILYIAAYLTAGADVLYKAVRNITHGRIFDENFLMTVATAGAFLIASYTEAVAVMLFYQIGETFQSYAVSKSRKSIADLMDIRPDYANLQRENGTERVDPEDVNTGDIIIVEPGERIPLDGTVISGTSSIDASALTGESLPKDISPGDEVLSGCINLSGVLSVRVDRPFEESAASRILDLVENAGSKKSKSENFITKFARYYTPFVVTVALLIAVIPPLVTGGDLSTWIYRALTFLVVSCPCALVISIPLSFFGGIGGASRKGILIKGGNYMEALSNAETAVFDKTGTMTKGVFEVQEIHAVNISEEKLIHAAACAEAHSHHPIAQSLMRAYGKEIEADALKTEEFPGEGVISVLPQFEAAAGNAKLMKRMGIDAPDVRSAGTVVHVAVDKEYAGYIIIADELKPDAAESIRLLRKHGIKNAVMLTGDRDEVGRSTAARLGMDSVYTELLPQDKVSKVEELIDQLDGRLIFIGDGINDAPVLARADVGIAMGGIGSDAAVEAADIVIMTDEPSKIPEAVRISKKTLKIVYENIALALGIKSIVLVAAAFGFAGMWEAIFADVGVMIIAVLNAFRLLIVRKEWSSPSSSVPSAESG